jgi:mRNA-degrading endonuclease RelE of RelBE toxin-antitoxin system
MYAIELTPEAEDDLRWFNRRERNIIVDGIKTNLSYQPTVITINRKPCRDDSTKIADWELRIGIYRVFYNVEEEVRVVAIQRIGEKPNNTVFFRGKQEE